MSLLMKPRLNSSVAKMAFFMAPEIQEYIRNMPPSTGYGLISLRRLLAIIRSRDHEKLRLEFHELLQASSG